MGVLEQFSLLDRTAIVTGGEGLLGKTICETIEELGGTSVSVDMKSTATICTDIIDPESVKTLINKFPEADILVNCAVGNQKPVHNIGEGLVDDINVGLIGAYNMIAAFGPGMVKKQKGCILNIGSDLSLIAPDPRLYEPGTNKPASYSIVKHGIVGMTRYFATLWGPNNVRCNCLCPGGIFIWRNAYNAPLQRPPKLSEMKGAVAFLCSDASSYVTGSTLVVDGGRTIW